MKLRTVPFLFVMMLLTVTGGFCGAISVSPAALSLKGAPGRALTQEFEISNTSDAAFMVDVDVQDVVVKEGKRTFVSPERTSASLAALVTISEGHIILQPGQRMKVPVTFVAPDESRNRAVVVFFHAFRALPLEHQPKVRLNLGTIVDFTVSNEVMLRLMSLDVEPQSETKNIAITENLKNVGPEPAIARGVVAILSDHGELVGKTAFEQKRLLPSERNQLRAEYPGTLKSGKYRAICTIEFAENTLTRTVDLVIP
jgi:hypothetical protein